MNVLDKFSNIPDRQAISIINLFVDWAEEQQLIPEESRQEVVRSNNVLRKRVKRFFDTQEGEAA